MERKQKIILISIISVFVIILLIILFSFFKKTKDDVNKTVDVPVKVNDIVSKPVNYIQNERNDIINTARGFTEMYGTYTNTNDFQNIKDLFPFMTNKLIVKFQAIIDSYKRSDNFYSKTTQALSVNMPTYKNGDTKASTVVSVVERVIDSTYKETINKKTYNVYLIKDNDKWKVDEIK